MWVCHSLAITEGYMILGLWFLSISPIVIMSYLMRNKDQKVIGGTI